MFGTIKKQIVRLVLVRNLLAFVAWRLPHKKPMIHHWFAPDLKWSTGLFISRESRTMRNNDQDKKPDSIAFHLAAIIGRAGDDGAGRGPKCHDGAAAHRHSARTRWTRGLYLGVDPGIAKVVEQLPQFATVGHRRRIASADQLVVRSRRSKIGSINGTCHQHELLTLPHVGGNESPGFYGDTA